jgi:Tfp pilus assembly protein PilV
MPSRALDLAREDGLTLVELLTVAVVMVMVVTAAFALYRVSANNQDRVQSKVSALQSQRNGLERMTRELRDASIVCQSYPACGDAFSDVASVDFRTCAGSDSLGCSKVWVRYDCSGTPAQAVPPALTTRACLRSESLSPEGLGAGAVLIGNVATSPTGVFSFTEPDYMNVSVHVVTKGAASPISIQDGVRLRNAIVRTGS